MIAKRRHGSFRVATTGLVLCSAFVTEDMQHGDTIDGMTIINPFRADAPSLLA